MKFKVGDRVRIVGPSNIGYPEGYGWEPGASGVVIEVVPNAISPYRVRLEGHVAGGLWCRSSSIQSGRIQMELFDEIQSG